MELCPLCHCVPDSPVAGCHVCRSLPANVFSTLAALAPKETCPVCQEEVPSAAMSTLDGCTHRFCGPCITKSLRFDVRCPVCRHAPEYAESRYREDDEETLELMESDTDEWASDEQEKRERILRAARSTRRGCRLKVSREKMEEARKSLLRRRRELLRDRDLRRLRGRVATLRRQCIRNEVRLLGKEEPAVEWSAVATAAYPVFREFHGFIPPNMFNLLEDASGEDTSMDVGGGWEEEPRSFPHLP